MWDYYFHCVNMKNSMRDVAKAAGVSIGTVSNVLNNKAVVSEKTRETVLKAAKEMGYNINGAARMLKTGRANAVGFIIPDISSIFFSIIVKQVEKILEQVGVTLIVSNSLERLDRQINHIISFSNGSVDAIIIASCTCELEKFEAYLPPHIPVLFVDRPIQSPHYSEISVSFHDPLYKATEDLLIKGYRKFGLIDGLKEWSQADYRTSGIIDCLNDHNILDTEQYLLSISEINVGAGPCALELYKKGCEVIFTPNSNCTEEAVFALLEEGAVINEDILLLAVNDDPRDRMQYASMFPCVVQPTYAIGTHIANRILQMIETPSLPPMLLQMSAEYRPAPTPARRLKKW